MSNDMTRQDTRDGIRKAAAAVVAGMGTEILDFSVAGGGLPADDSADIFGDESRITPITITAGRRTVSYVPFGATNDLPYEIIRMVGRDEVMSQNKLFNVLTCYGAGIRYVDRTTGQPVTDGEVGDFIDGNDLASFFLEQATDMKYFYFAVSVIILNRERSRIVQLRHKDASHCRLTVARGGRIENVVFGDFRTTNTPRGVEVIPLLDITDPLGDLMVRLGRKPGRDGLERVRDNYYKYAILTRFPVPGTYYYPIPYYTAIFRGDWYDIKRLIGAGKKAKLRNTTSIRYHVEVHRDYWINLCTEEGITDPLKVRERIKKEKANIRDFVTGIENSGKVWISGFYNIDGHDIPMVRINKIDTAKEGGDWSEDIEEASNITCYGDNIHPNLVGATPGKSQSNNSGSDKRELFTLKQYLETAFHDIMLKPHRTVIRFNGWDVRPEVPIITLTTLDQHKDAKVITPDAASGGQD